MTPVTPELLLRAYAYGVFPMARSHSDPKVYWIDPKERGVLPLDMGFHIPRSLRKTLRRGRFRVACNTDFAAVVKGCAESTNKRPDTWINDEIESLFNELYEMGLAHSVETWHETTLVGGLYGVALGGAFFGESMFSKVADASKVALCHLVARLRLGGFTLLDTQFITNHLVRFGAHEISKKEYQERLAQALCVHATFPTKAPCWMVKSHLH